MVEIQFDLSAVQMSRYSQKLSQSGRRPAARRTLGPRSARARGRPRREGDAVFHRGSAQSPTPASVAAKLYLDEGTSQSRLQDLLRRIGALRSPARDPRNHVGAGLRHALLVSAVVHEAVVEGRDVRGDDGALGESGLRVLGGGDGGLLECSGPWSGNERRVVAVGASLLGGDPSTYPGPLPGSTPSARCRVTRGRARPASRAPSSADRWIEAKTLSAIRSGPVHASCMYVK